MLIWPLGVYADYGGNQNKDLPETWPTRRASPRRPKPHPPPDDPYHALHPPPDRLPRSHHRASRARLATTATPLAPRMDRKQARHPRSRPCCPRRASRASRPRVRAPAPNLTRSSRARRFCSRLRRSPSAAVARCSPPHARFAQPQSGAARQSCSFAQAPTPARAARRRAAPTAPAVRERVATLGPVRSADTAG